MNKIPYDGFNPLQNISAFLINQGVTSDPALAFLLSGVAAFTVIAVIGFIVAGIVGGFISE